MYNKIQMIITDLDRSLLNDERQITGYTENVFRECIKNGIIVVFATARPLRATKIFYESILPHAMIYNNGATVHVNNRQIYQCGIKPNAAKDLLDNILKYDSKANLAIESNDQIYANFDVSTIWAGIVSREMDMENFPETEIDKVIIEMDSIEKIKPIEKLLPEGLYLEISEGKLGLIMSKGATKWNAVKELLKYYKIEIENTIAFGDDYNDLEMIRNCGIGIAMENGIDEVKKNAKYICGNNEEDGIAKWIEGNVLKI